MSTLAADPSGVARYVILALCLCTLVLVPGCDPYIPIGFDSRQFDTAIAEVNKLRTSFERESSEWRRHLENMQSNLRADVEYSIGRLVADAGKGAMCYTVFIENKVVNYLRAVEQALIRKRLEYQLHGEKALNGAVDAVISEIIRTKSTLDPHVCAIPTVMEVTHIRESGRTSFYQLAIPRAEQERITGYAFQRKVQGLYLEVMDRSGHQRLLGLSEGNSPVLVVNNDYEASFQMKNMSTRIQEGDQKIILKCDGKELANIRLKWTSPVRKAPWSDQAENLTFKKIDGGRDVVIKNFGESIYRFTEKVDGGSTVIIFAPKSRVEFSTPPSGLFGENEGSKIDGGSWVLIVANSVEFKGKIANANTRVWVVLTNKAGAKGSLVFWDEVINGVPVQWYTPDDSVLPTLVYPKNGKDKISQLKYKDMVSWMSSGNPKWKDITVEDLEFLEWYNNNGGK